MKHVKLFEQFLSEANSSVLASVKAALPGVSLKKMPKDWPDFDPDEYDSVEAFSIKVPGMDDDLYLEVFNGNSFCFQYGYGSGYATPIATSAHSKSDAAWMAQTAEPVPLPLEDLNKAIFDEVVKNIKDLYEDFVNHPGK